MAQQQTNEIRSVQHDHQMRQLESQVQTLLNSSSQSANTMSNRSVNTSVMSSRTLYATPPSFAALPDSTSPIHVSAASVNRVIMVQGHTTRITLSSTGFGVRQQVTAVVAEVGSCEVDSSSDEATVLVYTPPAEFTGQANIRYTYTTMDESTEERGSRDEHLIVVVQPGATHANTNRVSFVSSPVQMQMDVLEVGSPHQQQTTVYSEQQQQQDLQDLTDLQTETHKETHTASNYGGSTTLSSQRSRFEQEQQLTHHLSMKAAAKVVQGSVSNLHAERRFSSVMSKAATAKIDAAALQGETLLAVRSDEGVSLIGETVYVNWVHGDGQDSHVTDDARVQGLHHQLLDEMEGSVSLNWYVGRACEYNPVNEQHRIRYEDGDIEWHNVSSPFNDDKLSRIRETARVDEFHSRRCCAHWFGLWGKLLTFCVSS